MNGILRSPFVREWDKLVNNPAQIKRFGRGL